MLSHDRRLSNTCRAHKISCLITVVMSFAKKPNFIYKNASSTRQ